MAGIDSFANMGPSQRRFYVADLNGDGLPEVINLPSFSSALEYLPNHAGSLGPRVPLGLKTSDISYTYVAGLDATGRRPFSIDLNPKLAAEMPVTTRPRS